MPTASKDVVIRNKVGLHARPAMQFVDVASKFTSDIKVQVLGPTPVEADGKSIMAMITLEATEGTPMRITATGDDAETAVQKLAELIDSKFGEE
jgi:phosphotransferase system HPr (HPr) family protein